MTLAPAVTARARCADPAILPVIDAAFTRPGGPAQRQMENEVCPGCPIWEQCLRDALATGEHGPWGGTSERQRRRVIRRPSTFNIAGQHSEQRRNGHQSHVHRLRHYGIDAADVKQWAVDTGRRPSIHRGPPALDLIEAYASEHGLTSA